jgi:hypothetical protein
MQFLEFQDSESESERWEWLCIIRIAMPLLDNRTTICLYLIGLALPMESLVRAVELKETK